MTEGSIWGVFCGYYSANWAVLLEYCLVRATSYSGITQTNHVYLCVMDQNYRWMDTDYPVMDSWCGKGWLTLEKKEIVRDNQMNFSN